MDIKTERLILRCVAAEDWRDFRDIWADFSASPYARYDRPNPLEDEAVKARIARWASFAGSEDHFFFGVCLNGRVIGYIALHRRDGGAFECGYCFHSAFHRQGYAGESFRAVIARFREMGAKKLTAGTALDNVPSVGLLTSLGFELTGTERISFYKDAEGNDIFFEGGLFELAL